MPPLCRRTDARRTIDFAENRRFVDYMGASGTTRLLYGGNAFLYHITLAEYEELLGWLQELPDQYWCIPSAGPSYGRLMDQAAILRRHKFPTVMHLPCGDPRDAAGLEAGLRDFADACGLPLILYVKDENNLGANQEAGLDALGRLANDGTCIGIKYAVVRKDPSVDAYLDGLLKRVDRSIVISGIGERPAIAHLRKFGLPGFTTGSGCLAPAPSHRILDLCYAGKYDEAEALRQLFIPHEDLRDAWGPARVLHASTALAGIAETGAIPPFTTPLNAAQCEQLGPVAKGLAAHNQVAAATA
ncbi:MAG: dihydrodipicolinate synthase family protein [Acidobacteria bacterium]|nr:dihydrodipicolinate synthase family protein [Acidobacteriota bacterium]